MPTKAKANASKPKRKPRTPKATVRKSIGVGGGLRFALAQGQPGMWASDHREEARHYTGWNYVAIKAVANQAAQADVMVYRDNRDQQAKMLRKMRRTRKDYGQEAQENNQLHSESPLMQLMSRPNPTQSGAAFRAEQIIQLLLTGSCLVWKVPNNAGRTCERYVVPTAVAYPVRPTHDMPRGGWRIDPSACRWWSTNMMDEQGFIETGGYQLALGKIIPSEYIQVIRHSHAVWKDDGYSALAAGSRIIDSADQIDASRFSAMRNQASPSIVVSVPPEFDPTPEELDAIATKFNAKYAGTDNDGKAMFVTGGGSVVKLASTAKEMDYVLAFTQLRDAVMAMHGVPGIAAGITDGGSYAAFYASLKQFTMLTVQPVLDLLAEEDTEQLAPEFGSCLTVEMTAAAIDDPEVQERELQNDLAAGAITVGEWRAIRGRKPFGDERDNAIAGAAKQAASPFALPEPNRPTESSTGKPTGFPDVSQIVNGDDSEAKHNGHHHTNGHTNGFHRPSAVEQTLKAAIQGALESVETPEQAKAVLRGVRYP